MYEGLNSSVDGLMGVHGVVAFGGYTIDGRQPPVERSSRLLTRIVTSIYKVYERFLVDTDRSLDEHKQ